MTHEKLITIGLTCYNAAETIQAAVQSALAQDWPNFEVIVVDDCSSDDSVEIVHQMDEVQLIQHDSNMGPAAARNSIIQSAKGTFIAFFDDDDVSAPGRIKAQYDRILTYEKETGEDLIACYASGERVYPSGYKLDLKAIGSHDPVPQGAGLAQRILYFGGPVNRVYGSGTPSCSLMARKDVFEKVNGFDENFRRAEDLDFAVRLALMGGHFIGCPEKLFTQYATEGHDKSYEKNLEAELQLAEKHKDYLQSLGQYYYALNWPKLRYYHFCKDYGAFLLTLLGLLVRYPVQTMKHLLKTGPARLRHEAKMEDGA